MFLERRTEIREVGKKEGESQDFEEFEDFEKMGKKEFEDFDVVEEVLLMAGVEMKSPL